MAFGFNDGGRAEAGFKGVTKDCVCRAWAIAANRPYIEIYDLILELAKNESLGRRKRKSSPRTGVFKPTERLLAKKLGFEWVPTTKIGQDCNVELDPKELPSGRLVVAVSKHSVAVIDGVIHDIHDPSRNGTRCVYGYYREVR